MTRAAGLELQVVEGHFTLAVRGARDGDHPRRRAPSQQVEQEVD
jgi:hypothetical protein